MGRIVAEPDTPYVEVDTLYRSDDTVYRMAAAHPSPDASVAPDLPTPDAAPDRLDPALLKLAFVILLGAIAAILDTTIVNVALDTLGRDFGTSVTTIQWVSTGYLLALALVIPLTGWAIERWGARRVWLTSLALFAGGSALCGLAWSIGSLIAFRVVQGIGGGMLLPAAQTILAQAAGPKRFGRVMAIVAIPAQLGPVVGPVLGGVIVDDLPWRWIFYVNVPICAVAMVLAARTLSSARPEIRPRLDLRGLVLLSPGLGAVVYGFSESGAHGGFGSAGVLVPLLAGIAMLVAFTIHALRIADPLIDMRLFRVPSFAASAGLMFLFGMSLFGAMLLLPLYYQQVRGASALDAGLLLAPQGLGTMVALLVVGRLTDRIGPRPIALAGIALSVVGTIAYTQVTADTSEWLLGASLLIRGAGLGAAIVPVMAAAYYGLQDSQIPRASAATRAIQQVGGSLGTAILAVILQRGLTHHAPTAAGHAAAFGTAFWWSLGFAVLAVGPALLLPAHPPKSP